MIGFPGVAGGARRAALVGSALRARRASGPIAIVVAMLAIPARPEARAQPVAMQRAVGQRAIDLPDETLDQWIFGDGHDARTGTQSLEGRLTVEVERASQVCGLSETQRATVRLAGTGDIKHFLNRAAAAKREARRIHVDNDVGPVFQKLQPLQQQVRKGLFGTSSLFVKVLLRELTPEQAERWKRDGLERQWVRYRARAAYLIARPEILIPMDEEQRAGLLRIVESDTRPPSQFGQFDSVYFLHQLSRVPSAKLEPLFEPIQWRNLQKRLDLVKQYEPFLQSQGVRPYGSNEADGQPMAEPRPIEDAPR
ncbi:MAG: hypothetical protein FJ297_06285 [Planctomycetes bacterium]|nr:hypothetical protein [Planctomycetota bacterium]